ncbi:hypothetical protein [Holzapfeliella floricola]|nr:hypothetical protein [Holzapfeliella floricola]
MLLAVIGVGLVVGLVVEYVLLKQLLNRPDIDWQTITKEAVD